MANRQATPYKIPDYLIEPMQAAFAMSGADEEENRTIALQQAAAMEAVLDFFGFDRANFCGFNVDLGIAFFYE